MATRLPEAPLDITVQFGLTLRRQRDQRRWSQERLAAAANLNRTYVGELERGEAAASLNTAQKLATALGIELRGQRAAPPVDGYSRLRRTPDQPDTAQRR